MRSILTCILVFQLCINAIGQTDTRILTSDGAWCWFSDPRAIAVNGILYAGYVKSNGSIEVAKLNLESGTIQTDMLYEQLETDDHDNPALLVTGEGSLLGLYTQHGKKDLYINKLAADSKNFHFLPAQRLNPIDPKEAARFPKETITYANPVRLSAENDKLYCFGRWTGYKPNFMTSADDGKTWSKARVLITNYPFDSNNRPYAKYYSDGIRKIHITFTDGHPRNEPLNSVYYVCYEQGAFRQADGTEITKIESLPLEPKDASLVYRGTQADGRAWVADIGQTQDGDPVILYTRSPTERNHEYWYAVYSGNKWSNTKICDSGKWFPSTPPGEKEREPHYFGGMTIHPGNSNVVYLSRQVNGVFEIERWETSNAGKSWTHESITQNSTHDNVRPFFPRGLQPDQAEVVLWMENKKYIHYTDFQSSIRYSIRKN